MAIRKLNKATPVVPELPKCEDTGTTEYNGCGLQKIWATSENDPFYPACEQHDKDYSNINKFDGSKSEADKRFKENMLAIAGSNRRLRLKAKFYLTLVKALGWVPIALRKIKR